MILSGDSIREAGIIHPYMERTVHNGMSFGVSHCGYDVRIDLPGQFQENGWFLGAGKFLLAATLEQFEMPNDVVGVVHDKSTWARRGLSVFNTVIEPGWCGYLTLELVCHRVHSEAILVQQGDPIAQVVFHRIDRPVAGYSGKYQNQERGAQDARVERA